MFRDSSFEYGGESAPTKIRDVDSVAPLAQEELHNGEQFPRIVDSSLSSLCTPSIDEAALAAALQQQTVQSEPAKQQVKPDETQKLWRSAWELVKVIWNEHRGLGLARAIMTTGTAILPLATILFSGKLIDSIAQGSGSTGLYAAAVAGSALCLGALQVIDGYLQSKMQRDLDQSVDRLLSTGISQRPIEFLENPECAARVMKARENSHRFINCADRTLSLVNDSVQLLTSTLLVASNSVWVGLGILAATLPTFFSEKKYALDVIDLEENVADRRRKYWYTRWFSMEPTALKELKLLAKEKEMVGMMIDHQSSVNRESVLVEQQRTKRLIGSEVLSQAAVAGATCYFIWQALKGNVTVGNLTAIIGAITAFRGAAAQLCYSTASQLQDLPFIQDAFELMGRDFDDEPEVKKPSKHIDPNITPEIRLENLSLTYPKATRPALDGISLTIRPGECLGVVGANGAGKTTFINVLCGVYQPTAGRILIDGVDLSDIPNAEWHQVIGVMAQEFANFESLSIRQNIELGHGPPGGLTVEEAADVTGASAFIEKKLPDKYETVFGASFEGGRKLSGGQAQLVAASRAVARNPRVLVLDEPASHLDPIAEKLLLDNLLDLSAGQTRILISHRYGTLLRADRIVVLKEGKIDGIGTHAELLANNETYRKNFLLQAGPLLRGMAAASEAETVQALVNELESYEENVDVSE